MIAIRVRRMIEEQCGQLFPDLDIETIREWDMTDAEYDIYQVELADGRMYWAFDDGQTIRLLNGSGVYADVITAKEAIEQLSEMAEDYAALPDRSAFYK